MKRARKLTPREAEMKRRYTRITRRNKGGGLPEYCVELAIDFQYFHLAPWFEDKPTAEWTRDMLAIALNKIKP